MGLARCELLLIDVGIVGAVQVLDEELFPTHIDTSVATGHAALVSTVIGQVNVRKDVVDRVLPSDDDLAPTGRKGDGSVGTLDYQAAV